MRQYLPMLIVRTSVCIAAVAVNGTFLGEASPGEHLALPVSHNGDYYVAIYPLVNGSWYYYPVVRKLTFVSGILQALQGDDVEAYAWPDGVFEVIITPGVLERHHTHTFPFTVDRIALPDGCVGTLYFENGLRFAVEQDSRIRYGTLLGDMKTGHVTRRADGLLCVVAGVGRLPAEDMPQGYGGKLLVLDASCQELLCMEGDAVGMEGDAAVLFKRLNTELGHESRQVFRLKDGAFLAEAPQIGFFTHSPAAPTPGRAMIRAFCDAVCYELWEEALSYLTTALREGLNKEVIRDCLGQFDGCRTPFVREDAAIGLTYSAAQSDAQQRRLVTAVRMFSFTFEDGKIDNLAEE